MDEITPTTTPAEALFRQRLEEARAQSQDRARLKEASEDFEALFVYMLLRTMRQTVMKSGLLESGLSEEIMEGMLDQELSRTIAHRSQLGIAEMVYRHFSGGEPMPEAQIKQKTAIFPQPLKRFQASVVQERLKPYQSAIQRAAAEQNLDPALLQALIFVESAGNPRARSSKGAMGLAQLMPVTAAELGIANPFDPVENIRGGALYLKKMLDRFAGQWELALAAYNAGPAAVEKYQQIPPFPETRRYVRRVLHLWQLLKNSP